MAHHVVRVEPAGLEFPIRQNETVFAAALRAGLRWPTECFGQARCTHCALRLEAGFQHACAPTESETVALKGLAQAGGRRRPERDLRLACQLRLTGDVTVRKPGVRPEIPDEESSA